MHFGYYSVWIKIDLLEPFHSLILWPVSNEIALTNVFVHFSSQFAFVHFSTDQLIAVFIFVVDQFINSSKYLVICLESEFITYSALLLVETKKTHWEIIPKKQKFFLYSLHETKSKKYVVYESQHNPVISSIINCQNKSIEIHWRKKISIIENQNKRIKVHRSSVVIAVVYVCSYRSTKIPKNPMINTYSSSVCVFVCVCMCGCGWMFCGNG